MSRIIRMIGRGGGRFLAAFACAGLAAVLGLIAPVADADTTLAHWRFEPGTNFLSDSSGNGYHLTGTAAETNDVANGAGGTGSAYFNGSTHSLKTISAINYAGVSHVRITFALRVANSAIALFLENSPNANVNPGAFNISANELAAGNGAAGYKTTGSYNVDQFPHAYTNAGWDLYQVDIQPGRAASNVVVLTRNGVTLSDSTAYGLHDTANPGFHNGVFFLGAGTRRSISSMGTLTRSRSNRSSLPSGRSPTTGIPPARRRSRSTRSATGASCSSRAPSTRRSSPTGATPSRSPSRRRSRMPMW